MNRRDFIKTTSLLPTAAAVSALPRFSLSAFAATSAKWRVFEVTTKVDVLKPAGTTRAWLPLPLVADTDYQKNLGSTWSIEGGSAVTATDGKYGAELVSAEWPESVKMPRGRFKQTRQSCKSRTRRVAALSGGDRVHADRRHRARHRARHHEERAWRRHRKSARVV